MEIQNEIVPTQSPRKIATFNKDVLLNTYFEHTDLFCQEAKKKLEQGYYCGEVYKSKKYNLYWSEQRERCIHGYLNPETKLWIPGYMYGFLNFKPMKILQDPTSKVSRRILAFPRFWPIHYFYLMSLHEAMSEGLDNVLLKPRGTGFSELHSWIASSDYTFQSEDPGFFFVSNEGYLNKDGILTKCWENIDFLSGETERAFRHLRQKKDLDMHKRASKWDPIKQKEVRTGGEIIGRIIDHARKVRGARGKVFWEESGSFPNMIDAWIATRALVEQGGVKFAMQIAWGTGGEQGPGIAGLEELFRNPVPYNCLQYDACWTDQVEKPHGFFFPTWASMDKFMDKWGNTDFKAAKEHHDIEREKIYKHSPHKYDKHIAEYPYTPDEALMRLTGNHFPVAELQKQLLKVKTSSSIQGIKKHGFFSLSEGEVQFVLDPKARPIDSYPHKTDGSQNLDGCVTIVESPLKEGEFIPNNLYEIVVDPFYVDEAEDQTSLGAVYVYKKKNLLFATEQDILVAWYIGRPRKSRDFHKLVFQLARYYNAKVNSEILGGGQNLLDYAKEHGFIHYCAPRPSIFNTDKEEIRSSQKSYFINMSKELKKQALQDLADWLLTERALQVTDEKTQYILNLDLIYDPGLLEELIKFSLDGNFDRISALLVLMVIRREVERVEVEKQERQNGGSVFDRPLYTDRLVDRSNMLPLSDMLPTRDSTPKFMPKVDGGDLIF